MSDITTVSTEGHRNLTSGMLAQQKGRHAAPITIRLIHPLDKTERESAQVRRPQSSTHMTRSDGLSSLLGDLSFRLRIALKSNRVCIDRQSKVAPRKCCHHRPTTVAVHASASALPVNGWS